ncbi:hypothetical protein [Microbispora sp. ATCC PTA-5024]|uniref:hypothetical protein n=1 Tax=Microbispora sp. ATCC PTA-5024 TaxID=316330 RepID=UPI00040CE775|nr:hypothetical protein [Microbispora sp. ATCC PTA-5024]
MRHMLRRNGNLVLRVLESELAPVARPGPFVLLWRWRYEAALLAGGPAVVVLAVRTVGWAPTIAAGAVTALAVVVWPQARREVEGRFWCVVTPHRVRKACAEAMIVTRRGKLPMILWTRPESFGERLWVWCRAGISPGDLQQAHDVIAAACWLAKGVRVLRHPRRASLVIVDVIRRDEHPAPEEPAPGDTWERSSTWFWRQ